MLTIGVPKENRTEETRVALTPDTLKKLTKKGFKVLLAKGCGQKSGFPDEAYTANGGQVTDQDTALSADIVFKVVRPGPDEIAKMRAGSLLLTFLDPFQKEASSYFELLAKQKVDTLGMELIPRSSRAQSMDALSSQANIAGYRAVIEAAARYPRFFPLLMTSAGSAKPAKLTILGAGVAGLQAIATAKRLGCQVEAYDVRAAVKEEILSLGAKFIELDLKEEGTGTGGYAKELSEDTKRRQQELLTEKLKKADVIVSTANIPGKKAPVLITEDAVKGMRPGSVIIDMAASSGGNCPLTEADKIVVKHGVILVGLTNYPAMVPADASLFYSNNLISLLDIVVTRESDLKINLNLEDDIVAAALVTHNGDIRFSRK